VLSTCDRQGFRATLVEVNEDALNGAVEVAKLSEHIAALSAERQELRTAGASNEALEENRVQLGRSQWALCHALIEQHLPGFSSA
jgi:phosphoenolpyruvate carboxylase